MRVTEMPNPHTSQIDRASIPEMVQQLGKADGEIYGSPEWGPGLFDSVFLQKLALLKERIAHTLKHPMGRVVLSGAGTSGRLALHAAAVYDSQTGPGQIVGLMAGGVNAFYHAAERVEDMPEIGVKDLTDILPEEGPLVYVGITCGLSAAYVAGQACHAMKRKQAYTAVLGFNSLEDAARRPLSGMHGNFHSILQTLEADASSCILNPIIGSEPITGSTRMKGGSATRIILDCLLARTPIHDMLAISQQTQNLFYQNGRHLKPLIEKASKALIKGGGMVYLAGPREGLMAMLDASECPPTFGSSPHQVQAFVDSGFSTLLPHFPLNSFLLDAYTYKKWDAVFTMGQSNQLQEACRDLPNAVHIHPAPMKEMLNSHSPALLSAASDLFLKWTLNAISTCAFIQCGKVYGNKMIDLKISNLKLWDRAARIVGELGEVEPNEANSLLKRAIGVEDSQDNQEIEALIPIAVRSEKVVATAILMARKAVSPEQARLHLTHHPKLRDSFHIGT